MKGGLVGSLQGRLANEKQKGRHAEYSKLRSVGGCSTSRSGCSRAATCRSRRCATSRASAFIIGTRDSGARGIARQLLRANGVIEKVNATFIDEDLAPTPRLWSAGTADAAILVVAADSDKIQKLLRVPDIRLMDFTPEAEAYTNRFPALSKVVLRQGAVEFDPLMPTDDITLLSTSVALVVRPDMQPALVSLLTHAVVHNPKSGLRQERRPGAVLSRRASSRPPTTPSSRSRTMPASSTRGRASRRAEERSRRGAHSLRRAVLLSRPSSVRTAAKLIGMVGVLALLLPLTRAIPALYVWTVRRRLVYWYKQLKALERKLDAGGARLRSRGVLQAEFDRIDSHVRVMRVPTYYSNQLYDLRGHIDLVRQRLAMMPESMRMAAE